MTTPSAPSSNRIRSMSGLSSTPCSRIGKARSMRTRSCDELDHDAQICVADPRCAGDFCGSECRRESGLHRLGQLERNADWRGAVHHHGDGSDRRRHVGRWRGRSVGRPARWPCERAHCLGARSSRMDRPCLHRRRDPACWRRVGNLERNHGRGRPGAADYRDSRHISRLPGDYA